MTSENKRIKLAAVFDEVKNQKHWKLPINKVISTPSTERRALIEEAVIYFTGSVPSFTAIRGGKVRVQADGYYAAIGA